MYNIRESIVPVEDFLMDCENAERGVIFWGPWPTLQSSWPDRLVVVERIHSDYHLIDIAIPATMPLSWLKTDRETDVYVMRMWSVFCVSWVCWKPFTQNFSTSLPSFFCSIMVKQPLLCRDAHQIRPVPLPLPHAQTPFSIQLWSRWRQAHPVLPVPPRAWALEETQLHRPPRPGSRSPLQLPAGPSCCPWAPGAAPSGSQLWCASWSGRWLVRSGLRVSEPPRHAAAAGRTRGAEGHHHGAPGAQNPEHAAGPQEGVGVSIKEIQRQMIPLKLYV